MLAAVAGLRDARAAERRLLALSGIAEHSDRRRYVLTQGSAGLLATGSDGRLDAAERMAWVGRPRPCSADALRRPFPLRGDFAIAALAGKDELVLARGRFGGRPLYWATNLRDGVLLACSEFAPLAAALDDVRVNANRLAAFAVLGTPSDHTQTYYREIHRVPSACVLRIGPEGIRARHDIPFDVVPCRTGHVDQLADELREQILGAVSRALEGVGHVGVLVSGGLDSSAVLASASAVAGRNGKRVEAFNLQFEAPGDDRPHLRALCESLGVSPVCVAPRECGSVLQESFVIDGAPTGWPGASWDIAVVRKSVINGVALMLTGAGGDEVFGGDFRTFAYQARNGHVLSAFHSAASLKAMGTTTPARRVRSLIIRPLIMSILPRLLARAVRSRQYTPWWAGPTLRRFLAQGAFEVANAVDPRASPTERSWLDAAARSGIYLYSSEATAQMELAGGCMRAHPLLDDDIVEFLASLRPELLFYGNWSRGLFRHAMRGLLPETLRLRTDKSRFHPALRDIVEAAGGFSTLEPLAKATALADLGLVEPRRFRERFDELARAPSTGHLWVEIWLVLAAEAFLRQARGS